MSHYTTGEMARLCGVTVRTVQYYDARGILCPSALSEGGRRLYDPDDLRRLKIICFLRELGLSIDAIGQLLSEEDPGSVIELLLEQQEGALREELAEGQAKLEKLEGLRRELRHVEHFSVESLGDIADTMANKSKLDKVHRNLLLLGLPLNVLELGAILLWIFKGLWWAFVAWVVVAIPWGVGLSRYYFRSVAYLCPRCHRVFRPGIREAFFAPHTPKTRKLTCACCGQRGFCVEIAAGSEEKNDA